MKKNLFPSNERLTTVAKNSQANLFRLYALRGSLEREIKGIKGGTPTTYIRIKREFGLTGSRKNVLNQLSDIIRIHHEQIDELDNS